MSRTLLVEDDVKFRAIIATAFAKDGHSLIGVSEGATAFKLVIAVDVDLLITDVVLAECGGIELISKLRKTKNPVPIIAVSGHTQPNIKSSPVRPL